MVAPDRPTDAYDLWWVIDHHIATYQRTGGDVHNAVTAATTARHIATTYLGPNDPHTLSSRNDLALAYEEAGDLDRAIPLFLFP